MSEPRARLFAALELPEDVRDALVRWRGQVLAPLEGLRPTAPENLHATLCFLGSREQREVASIAAACGVVARQPAPELVLGAALALPRRRPRVLAVSLQDPSGLLGDAQAALSRALEQGGWYESERRPYLAHVTVARTGRGDRVRMAEPPEPPPPMAFRAAVVTLYRSRSHPGGARYEPLASVELGPPS